MSTQLVLARSLVAAGISVIPIGRNKQPSVAWKEFQTRIANDSELQSWYGRPDQNGIGIVCGAVSGNLEVLDFDLRHRPDLIEVVNTFVANVMHDRGEGDMPDDAPSIFDGVALVETPGPGAQLIYRCESPIGGSQKLASHNGARNLKTGKVEGGPAFFVETRAEGGYALTCGSPSFCHPKGGKYRFAWQTRLEDLKPISTEQRDTMLLNARWIGVEGLPFESTKEMSRYLRERVEPRPASVSVPIRLPSEPTSTVGDDFAARTSWAEILAPHGFELVGVSGEEQQWKRPGTTNPLSATTNHDGSGLFYAFSPNCGHGIEPNRGYNKFAIHALLNNGGDFSAAARALADAGFGERRDLSHINIDAALLASANESAGRPFGFKTFEEFMAETEETEYLIEGVFAAKQSCIIGGPEKVLKTSISLDLAHSLSTGTPFLGRFRCLRAVRVGIMTGESNSAKIRRSFRTIASSRSLPEIELPAPKILITSELPDLSSEEQLQRLEATIREEKLEVLITDPAYMCLGKSASDTSNVALMGNFLRRFGEIEKATGCTLVLIHHTNRKGEPWQPLTLRDMSGAGFAEWARQWLLICPRKPFEPETYQHSLWMVAGGSAGHAGRYAVNVREKDDAGEWAWIADVRSEGQERADYREAKVSKQEQAKKDKAVEFANSLSEALKAGAANGGSTVNELKSWFTASGIDGVTKIKNAKLEEFAANGFAKRGERLVGNNKPTPVWLPAESA